MLRLLVFISIFGFFNSCSSQTKEKYEVISIDSIPSMRYYLVKLNYNETQYNVISSYEEMAVLKIGSKLIEVGKSYPLVLTEIKENANPFKILVESNRRGSGAIYVDGKPAYDPSKPLYSANCLKGLMFVDTCK